MLIEKKMIAPWRITFDTNPDQCNLNCIMCEGHSKYKTNKKKTNRIMDFKIIEDVVEDAVKYGLKEIIPSTMGEPLLYKDFIDLLNLIKRYKLKLNLTTNGTFPSLGAEEWGNLILPIASDIKISINGASKEVNESIMEGINFKRQIENIIKFVQIRDSIRNKGINYPTITLQATFMNRNLNEIPGLLRMAIKMGVDRFKGHHLWVTHPELERESLRKGKSDIKHWNNTVRIMNQIVQNERLKNGNKIKLDNIYSLPYKTNSKVIQDNYICPFLGREAWIAWDGTFNVCCAPDDLRKTFGYIGNIKNTSFMEIWNSKIYGQLVESWGKHNVCKICNMRRPIEKIMGCRND